MSGSTLTQLCIYIVTTLHLMLSDMTGPEIRKAAVYL